MTTHILPLAIKASRAEIWHALTDSAVTPAYYYGFQAHYPAAAGEAYSYVSEGRDVIVGQVLELAPEERIRMTFNGSWAPDVAELDESVVTIELSDTSMGFPGVTVLTLTHEGLPAGATSHSLGQGWVVILSGLKTLLETGAPLVRPTD